MQAAFVDIGLSKDAFLYAGDYTANLGEDDGAVLREGDEETPDEDPGAGEPEGRGAPAGQPIEEVLARGQEILVQVSKESLGTKGARITSFISLPGRYIVYMPQARHVGVSRRIRDEQERDRLRGIVKELRRTGDGFIVRTVAEGKGEAELAADIEFLGRLWSQIQGRFDAVRAPSLLHEEMDLTFRVVRDLFSPEVDEFLVDTQEAYEKCLEFATSLVPQLAPRVKRWEDRRPIFEATGIEKEIEKALRRRVWLKSGGYIVIDHTEALVAIDVNTGKYVGKRDFEETVLKINLEAVTEVVRQIRLRDLGGIIIIDFIDMERAEHREQVSRALRRALAEDKARSNVLEISELGIVEMTRKRARQGLQSMFCAPCPTCRGSGVVRSDATLAAEIFRKLQAEAPEAAGMEAVVRAHPDMAHYLDVTERDGIERLQALTGKKLTVQPVATFQREEYEVSFR
jgi:ribonuclease G